MAPKDDQDNLKELGEALAAYLKFGEDSGESPKELLERNSALRDLIEPLLDADGDYEVPPDPAAAELPAEVLGDYKLIKLIGSGGMGSVYKARQMSLDRIVALKVLPPHMSINPRSLTRFRREATAGAKLRDPGIVTVHAVGEDQGLHYIAQEYVEGERTLHDFILEAAAQTPTPEGYERGVALLIAQVAEALQSAHDAGVIHRDVKPRNILLSREGLPRVADFGLARMLDSMTMSRAGDVAGTPYYMSPEQAEGDQDLVDSRTDVFSLGVTLFEALAFERPYDGRGPISFRLMDPPDPRRIRPTVPEGLAVICLKALQVDPDKRYQTMRSFAQALRSAPLKRTVSRKPLARRTGDWMRDNTVAATATASVALVLALGAGFAIGRAGQARAEIVPGLTPQQEAAAAAFWSQPVETSGASRGLSLLQWLDARVEALDANPLADPAVEANVRRNIAAIYTAQGLDARARRQNARADALTE